MKLKNRKSVTFLGTFFLQEESFMSIFSTNLRPDPVKLIRGKFPALGIFFFVNVTISCQTSNFYLNLWYVVKCS